MKLNNHSLRVSVVLIVALSSAVTTLNAALTTPVEFSGNGHSYQVFTTSDGSGVTWYDARTAAIQMGGYLATVTSQAENDFVSSLLWLYSTNRG
jgi:hypothetical protein